MFHIMQKLLIIVAFRGREPRSSRPNFHFPDEGVKSHTSTTGCFQLKCIRKKIRLRDWKRNGNCEECTFQAASGPDLAHFCHLTCDESLILATLWLACVKIGATYTVTTIFVTLVKHTCLSLIFHLITRHLFYAFLKSKKMSGKLEIRWLLQYGNSVPLVKWFAQVLYFFFLTTLYI